MKNWWFTLAQREKLSVSLGGVFILIFVFYWVVWAPLSDAVDNAATHYRDQIRLLDDMRTEIPAILALKKNSLPITNNNQPLLTQIEQSVNHSNLTNYLTNIEQENELIHIHFDSVPFDDFISWFQTLNHSLPFVITDMNITRLSTDGLTAIDLTLK